MGVDLIVNDLLVERALRRVPLRRPLPGFWFRFDREAFIQLDLVIIYIGGWLNTTSCSKR